jgi:hypothetical protein
MMILDQVRDLQTTKPNTLADVAIRQITSCATHSAASDRTLTIQGVRLSDKRGKRQTLFLLTCQCGWFTIRIQNIGVKLVQRSRWLQLA